MSTTSDLSAFSDSGEVAKWASPFVSWAVGTQMLVSEDAFIRPSRALTIEELNGILMGL